MSFWRLSHPAEGLALVDEGASRSWTYGELSRAVQAFKDVLPRRSEKGLGLIVASNTPAALIAYLAALQLETAISLQNAGLSPQLFGTLLEAYRPDWLWLPEDGACPPEYQATYRALGYMLLERREREEKDLHPDLAILLSTSGTTGSQKLVRLSYRNLEANAASIATYLTLSDAERPITTLPMAYSYGLSVMNSHLLVGATLLMTDKTITTREFWRFFGEQEATSIAGVPYLYQMLKRIRFERMELPSLKTLTQAGGFLDEDHTRYLSEEAGRRGWRFFKMYGQTEATARISYLPPSEVQSRPLSIGVAIPGGELSLEPETQELVYRGSNVMMGYATELRDLSRGDEQNGVLHTGDLARQDEDGYYYLTGRIKRFIKLFGLRVSLDEVERLLEREIGPTVACCGSDIQLIVALETPPHAERVRGILRSTFQLPASAYRVMTVERIPRLTSGKIDYAALNEQARHD